MLLERFRVLIRMNQESFNTLTLLIQDDPIFKNCSPNSQAPVSIQLATALYFLGSSGASVVRGAAQLGIGEGTSRLYCDRSIAALVRLLPQFLTWPEPGGNEFLRMRRGVKKASGFPECIGFLDGMDMTLQRSPSYHSERYFNREKRYALNIQAICDSNRRFTFVLGGYPASVGDATVFCGTSFFKQPNVFFSRPEEYILADKAYRITRRCITPYKEPLGSQEVGGYREFNLRLAATRVKIEHAFGVLKSRWGSLQGIPINIRRAQDHVRVLAWIMSCILLHNFLYNFESDEVWISNCNMSDGLGDIEEDEIIGIEAERRAGAGWRDQICEFFLYQ